MLGRRGARRSRALERVERHGCYRSWRLSAYRLNPWSGQHVPHASARAAPLHRFEYPADASRSTNSVANKRGNSMTIVARVFIILALLWCVIAGALPATAQGSQFSLAVGQS